jgi:hypothetical protein
MLDVDSFFFFLLTMYAQGKKKKEHGKSRNSIIGWKLEIAEFMQR